MKRIRSEKLTRTRPGTSTVTEHVTIELFELPADAGHVVHLSSSRDGLQWRETVLTPAPLALDKAMAVFGDALAAQLSRGLALEGAPIVASAPAAPIAVAASLPLPTPSCSIASRPMPGACCRRCAAAAPCGASANAVSRRRCRAWSS